MIDLKQKNLSFERIQWRRLKSMLKLMRDEDGVIRDLYIEHCVLTALPRTIKPTDRVYEDKPWWVFWRLPQQHDYLLGFEIEDTLVEATTFYAVPKRTAKKGKKK